MLHIATTLPPGALIGGEERALAQLLVKTGAARFVARAADVLTPDGRITGWREARGAVVAEPSGPNTGNSRFDEGPPAALICEEGRNCGFTLPAFAPRVEAFTAAILYSSEGKARTLLSVSTGQSNNLIFLSEIDGRLSVQDRSGAVAVSLPIGSEAGVRSAVIVFDGRALRLATGNRVVSASGVVPGMDHPADFFIGCRSSRPGLQKTLGQSRLHEVMFWPDRALLGSDAAADREMLAALDRYLRWVW